MTREDIFNKVQAIFRDVFDDSELEIKYRTNAEDIEDWDSLAHINLVVAIQQEFKIHFLLGELEELKNVGEMIELIQQKISV